MTNTAVNDNHLHGFSPTGTATVLGGAVRGSMTLRHATVNHNTGTACGATGIARGGGIFSTDAPLGPPAGPLTLVDSTVTHNSLHGSAGITRQGGGVFATDTVAQTRSVVAHNHPDQCVGC